MLERQALRLSSTLATLVLLALSVSCAPSLQGQSVHSTPEPTSVLIVQGYSVQEVSDLVAKVGGTVTDELPIINAVVAKITPSQRSRLDSMQGIRRVFDNRQVRVGADPAR